MIPTPMRPGDRPRLLDLFCGAGGAAMGYHRAGFEIVGVDLINQPRYPFEFHQADALTFPLDGFDAIHASPPCQGYSALRHLPWLADREYPLLIDPVRERLVASGAAWAIENVERAPLMARWGGVTLCGLMFGLRLYRHRRFESNAAMLAPGHPRHPEVIFSSRKLNVRYSQTGGTIGVLPDRDSSRGRGLGDRAAGHTTGARRDTMRAALGIDWMTRDELTQAIPPAYTHYVGEALLAHLGAAA